MARSFQNPHGPEFQKLSSPISNNSPLSPIPRDGTPVSFRTNVNRAKTKRWVEAKKYSYDGNDWGEDEYDEYDDEPSQLPQPASFSQSTGDLSTRPPIPVMDRSRSMDQVATLESDSASRRAENQVVEAATDKANSTSPMPFVRPADIYKKMQQERAEQEQSPDIVMGLPATDPASESLPPASGDHTLHQPLADGNLEKAPSQIAPDTPKLQLPDIKHLSGFGTNFFASDPLTQKGQSPESQTPRELQHNPSLGFRSVVHQAFDVPETPSTIVDSVGRSNSDSTSAISPIISNRGLDEEKTPTIVEEPGESTTPRDTDDRPPLFKPGHRRDLSVPSPDNSPSRTPVVSSNDTVAPPTLAELSAGTPLDSPQDSLSSSYQPNPLRASVQLPRNMPENLPAPLNISTNSTVLSNKNIPVIVPSISAESSPHDMESDRLRKEIIRSLSRENTPSDEPEQQNPSSGPQISQQDTPITTEPERYQNEEASSSPQDQQEISFQQNPAPHLVSEDVYSSPTVLSSAPVAQQEPRPKAKRRFSWESSSSEGPQPADIQPPSPSVVPIPRQYPMSHEGPTQLDGEPGPREKSLELDEEQNEGNYQYIPEKPKLAIVPPSELEGRSIVSGAHLPEVVDTEKIDNQQDSAPAFRSPPSVEPTLLGFRDIMGIKSLPERVQAFDRTRDQFSAIDTGLKHWIQMTVQAHPEHIEIVEQSSKLPTGEPKIAVSKGKFPKLASLGNFASSHPDGSQHQPGHVRRPSAPLSSIMNKQQVEQRGKDLLHTAGALGGKAGEAAKGLFAKGRNKLKGGGNDKVDS